MTKMFQVVSGLPHHMSLPRNEINYRKASFTVITRFVEVFSFLNDDRTTRQAIINPAEETSCQFERMNAVTGGLILCQYASGKIIGIVHAFLLACIGNVTQSPSRSGLEQITGIKGLLCL